jgi:hypothetical protein
MKMLHNIAATCQADLLKRQLPCGGWSFNGSSQWSTEMTSLALLALRLAPGNACRKGIDLLLRQQNPDGSWPAFRGDAPEGSWSTALATLALIRLNSGWSAAGKGVPWLLETKGRESAWFEKWRYRMLDPHVQFDPGKYGWPWCPGSSSWVVPTAYSLIALQHYFCCSTIPRGSLRTQKGKEMLYDRACPDGGWNAGNSIAFGTTLDPQADVTALALMALLPERDHPVVKSSLAWLQDQVERISSIYSLSWMLMALADYGVSFENIEQKLCAAYDKKQPIQDTQTLTLIILASQAAEKIQVF